MKKLIVILFVALIGIANAESIYFDAEVKYTNVLNRYIRIAADVTPDMKARLTYTTLNGALALTGDLNNFAVGGQGVMSMKLMDGLTAEPFAGLGFASSDNGNAMYGDIGLDLKYKTFVCLVAGADVQIYSDSYMMDYKGGINIPLMNFFSLDLLYSATLTNDKHKMGAGARLNFVF